MNSHVLRIIFLSYVALAPMLPAGAENRSQIPVLIAAEPDSSGRVVNSQPAIRGIVALLAAESGLDLVLTPLPWRRAQAIAEKGEGLLYGAAMTPARARKFAFTKPLDTVNQWLVSTEQAPLEFRRWNDLRGKIVSIESGGHYSSAFEQHRDSLFRVEQNATSLSSRMTMLRAKRVDAVIVGSYLAASALETKLNCLFPGQVKLIVAGRPIDAEPMLIAVPRTAPLNDSLPVINEAIDRLVKSGAMQKFHSQKLNASGC